MRFTPDDHKSIAGCLAEGLGNSNTDTLEYLKHSKWVEKVPVDALQMKFLKEIFRYSYFQGVGCTRFCEAAHALGTLSAATFNPSSLDQHGLEGLVADFIPEFKKAYWATLFPHVQHPDFIHNSPLASTNGLDRLAYESLSAYITEGHEEMRMKTAKLLAYMTLGKEENHLAVLTSHFAHMEDTLHPTAAPYKEVVEAAGAFVSNADSYVTRNHWYKDRHPDEALTLM